MTCDIKDVAKLAGVSVSTVSNVRTGRKYVSHDLVQRVNAAIKQLDYKPNAIASRLRGGASKNIAVILPFFHHPFHAQVLEGIDNVCLDTGYFITAFSTHADPGIEFNCLESCQVNSPNGIIISSYAMDDSEMGRNCLELIRKMAGGTDRRPIPIVSIERDLHIPGVDSVLSDYYRSSYDAVSYLLSHGHKKIAHIAGPQHSEISQKRLCGYLDAMRGAQIDPLPGWVRNGAFTPISGYSIMGVLMTESPVSAVFAANDEIGIGVIKAVLEMGLRVPEDVAVIGCDNIYAGSLIAPSLSTIHIPSYQLGEHAVNRLIQRMEGAPADEQHPLYLETSIIRRHSTDKDSMASWDLYSW